MVVYAGFAIPNKIDVVDISLSENTPKVTEVLEVLCQFCSVEKMIIANETNMLKKLSKNVKAIIRTGDLTAYSNVILVSAAGDRWFFESL